MRGPKTKSYGDLWRRTLHYINKVYNLICQLHQISNDIQNSFVPVLNYIPFHSILFVKEHTQDVNPYYRYVGTSSIYQWKYPAEVITQSLPEVRTTVLAAAIAVEKRVVQWAGVESTIPHIVE